MLTRPFPIVYFEISGTCNAKCPWCERGCRARGMGERLPADLPLFASPELVEETLKSMLSNGIVAPQTPINLYNWGDPFMNPHFSEIVRVIKELNFQCGLSTNGSIPIRLGNDDDLSHVNSIRFSLPGFSQESYDRIHGFHFETIIKRIREIVETMRNHGMKGNVELFFMLYSFNIDEIKAAHDFCSEIGASFLIAPAVINAPTMIEKYMRGTLNKETLEQAIGELFLVSPHDVIRARPNHYVCPQLLNVLSISHKGMLSLCCVSRLEGKYNEYNIAPVKGMTLEDIHRIRMHHPRCRECSYYAIDHYSHEYNNYTANAVKSILDNASVKINIVQ